MKKTNPEALVLLSGGLDSAVTLAEANKKSKPNTIHFKYGQLTQRKESLCAEKLANHYENEYIEIELYDIFNKFSAGLTTKETDLSKHYDEDDIATSYVPMRNTIFLSIAAGIAEKNDIKELWYGPNQNDRQGYADCREEYIASLQETLSLGTDKQKFSIQTPLVEMDKADIVARGHELEVPFQHTWSCYQSSEGPCGECASCSERKEAFHENNLEDPINAYQ